MAKWQRTNREADRNQAGHAAGTDTKQPKVFTGHVRLERKQLDELMRRVAAPLGDSTQWEIVDPESGKFFQDPYISQPGGTDVPRP